VNYLSVGRSVTGCSLRTTFVMTPDDRGVIVPFTGGATGGNVEMRRFGQVAREWSEVGLAWAPPHT
jgi:hypothetical protein